MVSKGVGKVTDRGAERGRIPVRGCERTRDASLVRVRAMALSTAIDHLEEEMFLPAREGYDDPGLDEMPDVDEYDLTEYGEDGPYEDPDEPEGYQDGYDALDVPGPGLEPVSSPAIIIDPTGGVVIPAETWLQRRLAAAEETGEKLMLDREACRRVRKVAERMIREWREILLDPEKGINDLLPTSRAAFAARAEIGDKTYLDRIVAKRYVATPYWGVVPMAAFFRANEAREAVWNEVLEKALEQIGAEDPEHPKLTNVLWSEVKGLFGDAGPAPPNDTRMFRNRLNSRGIPAAPAARKQIFAVVEEWWKENGNPSSCPRSGIPRLRDDLIEKYGLFSSEQSKLCRGEIFRPFVEERIAKVLQDLNVKLTP